MNAHTARVRRVGTGVTAFGAVAGIIILAAPQAGAWPSNLEVSGGSTHNVGCSYTLTATVEVDRLTSVSFTDNGTELTGSPVSPSLLSNKVTINWTPTTTGSHELTATQTFIPKSITVQVSPQSSFGSVGCGLNGLFPSLSG
ncbi:hypothetical protein [Nocardia aurantiaca]|uniref:Ig-like domain-containing protein n=1 Tax=Nocardia aurantiaca TaxID=2675850 RepID=A0A6I3L021_9NOCA|nr:hypothetical protein [Nocardia aurantiaca]MTE13864.1 hypothetical protein [Nocardia aurantiaca]